MHSKRDAICAGAAILAFLSASACGAESVSKLPRLILQNGLEVSAQPSSQESRSYRYWNCEDTFIDRSRPEANFGASKVLECGSGKAVLIRFGDLNRAIGPGKKIVSAELVLAAADTADRKPAIRVHNLLRHWGEGAGEGTISPWGATWICAHSSSTGHVRRWEAAGAMGMSDRSRNLRAELMGARTATRISGPVKTSWNPSDSTLTISGLQGMISRQYLAGPFALNGGWLITATSECRFHSSEGPKAQRPKLILTLKDERLPANDVDLSVIYIERIPEYFRYDPNDPAYEAKNFHGTPVTLMKRPGLADKQKWPKNGEKVTFIAHIKNVGTKKSIRGFSFFWKVNDGNEIVGRYSKVLGPGKEARIELPWVWHAEHKDHRVQTISIRVDPGQAIRETTRANNCLRDYIEALNMGFWVEKSFCREFGKKPNGIGSFSIEDWIQWQVNIWNEVYMARSRYPHVAPDGCLERVRVQRIIVVPDGTLQGGNHIPGGRSDLHFDGEWGFAWNRENPKDTIDYINLIRLSAEGGLLHECSHQIGLNDLYVMNIDASLPDGTQGKVRLKAGTKHVITRGFIDPYGGLMGGGDTRIIAKDAPLPNLEPAFDVETLGLYASEDVGGLNTNVGKRRGYYGEYMYDLPQRVIVRVLDASGRPLPGPRLRFFQQRGGAFEDDPPVFEGITDESGLFVLPDQPTLEDQPFTVLTGHTLRPNPFGRICVVGGNGVFMVEANAFGQKEWQFLKIHELNVAFWAGHRESYIYDLKVNIAPAEIAPENLAREGIATDSRGSVERENAAKAVDGDLKTRWFADAKKGAAITIDLGSTRRIVEVKLIQNGQAGDFWQQFAIEASETGTFAGEERVFAREPSWGWTVGHKRDILPENFAIWSVCYRNTPVRARYVRIRNLTGGGGTLSEIEIRAREEGRE